MSKKMSKKSIILTFFQHFPDIAPLPLLNFGVDPKFDHTSLCVLLKLDYAKFGVSNLFFQKLSKNNLFFGGGGGKGRG